MKTGKKKKKKKRGNLGKCTCSMRHHWARFSLGLNQYTSVDLNNNLTWGQAKNNLVLSIEWLWLIWWTNQMRPTRRLTESQHPVASALLSIGGTTMHMEVCIIIVVAVVIFEGFGFFPWAFARLLNAVTGIRLKVLNFSPNEHELEIQLISEHKITLILRYLVFSRESLTLISENCVCLINIPYLCPNICLTMLLHHIDEAAAALPSLRPQWLFVKVPVSPPDLR